jgi:hypothetical protein
MSRTIKDATVKRFYYPSHDHLKQPLHTFLMAYNFAKRLKTLKGLTPYEYSCKSYDRMLVTSEVRRQFGLLL